MLKKRLFWLTILLSRTFKFHSSTACWLGTPGHITACWGIRPQTEHENQADSWFCFTATHTLGIMWCAIEPRDAMNFFIKLKPQLLLGPNSYRVSDLYSNTVGTRILFPLGLNLEKLPAVLVTLPPEVPEVGALSWMSIREHLLNGLLHCCHGSPGVVRC